MIGRGPQSETASRKALPTLDAVLEAARLPREARILELGGGAAGQKILAPVVARHDGPIFLIDGEAQDLAPQISRIGTDPFIAGLPAEIDLCVAAPPLTRVSDMFEGLLYDGIYDALREGGIAVLSFPRAAPSAIYSVRSSMERARKAVQDFLKHHFRTAPVGAAADIQRKFDRCPYFEFLAVASRGKSPFTGNSQVWLVLRKRTGAVPPGRVLDRAFPRSRRKDQYSTSELLGFFGELKDAGIEFLPVDEFSKRYAAFSALNRRQRTRFSKPFGHLKFDIHSNVRRAHEIAAMLEERSIPGLFLMMHRHPLNEQFYDSPATWEMLREIQAMGHEVGVHIDPFHLIRTVGNLHEGLRDALADLRKRGLKIRTATLHGDTREHIRATRLLAHDFFRERFRRSKWSGAAPEGEEDLVEHVARYSYRTIARRLGIEYVSDVTFVEHGRLITDEPLLYLSDNRRTIRIGSIPGRIVADGEFMAKTPFVIDSAFIDKAIEILRRRPFLALFHPQWFW